MNLSDIARRFCLAVCIASVFSAFTTIRRHVGRTITRGTFLHSLNSFMQKPSIIAFTVRWDSARIRVSPRGARWRNSGLHRKRIRNGACLSFPLKTSSFFFLCYPSDSSCDCSNIIITLLTLECNIILITVLSVTWFQSNAQHPLRNDRIYHRK